MTQVNTSHSPRSGEGMAMFGAPLAQGRAEFREWVKNEFAVGNVRQRSYQMAVKETQEETLVLHGIFGGVEVYFHANEYVLGAVLIDPSNMQAWATSRLSNSYEVTEWADDLGLHPRQGKGR